MKNILTYGVFDLMHKGHINIFNRAANLGSLTILVFTKKHVKENKGIITVDSDEKRVNNILSLKVADNVILVEGDVENILAEVIKKFDIDVIVLGSDHDTPSIRDWINNFGVEFFFVPRTKHISSTMLREEMRR